MSRATWTWRSARTCQASASHSSSAATAPAREPVSQSQRPRSVPGSSASTVSTARRSAGCRRGVAVGDPGRERVEQHVRPRWADRRRGGAARAASAASRQGIGSGPHRLRRAPSRCVQRACPASSGSNCLAAPTSSRAASPMRRWSNAISPRSSSISAASSASTGPASAAASSSSAASSAPASRLARAAASRRRARRAGSGVSIAALSRNAAAAATPPRASARVGRALELVGDLLVGTGRRLGAVPGAPVGIELGIGGLGQRGVQRAPLLRRGRAVGRRAHGTGGGSAPGRRSRTARPRPPASRPAGRCRAARPRARRAAARRPDRPPRAPAAGACRRGAARAVAGTSPPGSRPLPAVTGPEKPPASSAALMPRGSSSSSSGLPCVSATIRSRDVLVEPARARPSRAEPARPRGRALRAAAPAAPRAGARRWDRERRTRSRSARPAAAGRRTASTCTVASSSHCRSSTRHSSGCSSATAASSVSTARPTRKRSGAPPPHRPSATRSASCCGRRERVEPVEPRRAQLMQPRERQLPLGLDAGDLRDPVPGRPIGGVAHQRRLADAGHAADHEHRAARARARRRAAGPAPRVRWIGRGTPAVPARPWVRKPYPSDGPGTPRARPRPQRAIVAPSLRKPPEVT